MNDRQLQAIAAFSGAVAVVAGAFAAHGASGQPAEWLKTGSHYQLIHAVAALLGCCSHKARLSFLAGGWIFGGTLYAMALGAPRWFGAITPVGGVLLIVGWVLLALACLTIPERK